MPIVPMLPVMRVRQQPRMRESIEAHELASGAHNVPNKMSKYLMGFYLHNPVVRFVISVRRLSGGGKALMAMISCFCVNNRRRDSENNNDSPWRRLRRMIDNPVAVIYRRHWAKRMKRQEHFMAETAIPGNKILFIRWDSMSYLMVKHLVPLFALLWTMEFGKLFYLRQKPFPFNFTFRKITEITSHHAHDFCGNILALCLSLVWIWRTGSFPPVEMANVKRQPFNVPSNWLG